MAYSYLSKGDNILMISDSEVILFLSFIRTINNKYQLINSLKALRLLNFWHDLEIYGPGTLEINFLDFLDTHDTYMQFIDLIDLSLDEAKKMGQVLSKDLLNEITGESLVIHFEEIGKDAMIEILYKFKNFLLK